MARPRIVQDEGQLGFFWCTAEGRAVGLDRLVVGDDEPDRLVATHLSALDDALIIAASRFGTLLGGGAAPDSDEDRSGLRDLHREIDRLIHEYAAAIDMLDMAPDVRGGQIVGTAALIGIRARAPLGLLGPPPLEGELDAPGLGVVEGYGDLVTVDETRPWAGGRWVVRTPDGKRLPATLSMLLFDSSGVNKEGAVREHADLLRSVVSASADRESDPFTAASALDWLLFDWLMAHRDGPDSAAIDLKGKQDDAELVVSAAARSVEIRASFDPALLRVPSN